jgi:signal transduction histidine kinase
VDQYRPEALGLGLTLAHQALARYGAKFVVQSEPGRGTTITLVVPVKK